MNNLELLPVRLDESKHPDELLGFIIENMMVDLEGFRPTVREVSFLFTDLRMILTLKHLGCERITSKLNVKDFARDKLTQFFATTWVQTDSIKERRDSGFPDESEFASTWLVVFLAAFWIAFVVDDDKCIQLVSDWVETWFSVENATLTQEDLAIGNVLLVVAASFRSTALDGRAELEASILSGRKKMPKLLLKSWLAARDGDQAKFEEHLRTAVEEFRRRQNEKECLYDLLPVPHAIILAAGRKLGLQLPHFDPETLAYLTTPESVGLGSPKPWSLGRFS